METSKTPQPFTLGEVLQFCLAHRRAKGSFADWQPFQIAYVLAKAHSGKSLYITSTSAGVSGMVIAYPLSEDTLYIEHILCKDRAAFQRLIKLCDERYPRRVLAYNRGGRQKTLKQTRLERYAKC